MQINNQSSNLLPLEHSPKEILNIYLGRLAIFLAVAIGSVMVFGLGLLAFASSSSIIVILWLVSVPVIISALLRITFSKFGWGDVLQGELGSPLPRQVKKSIRESRVYSKEIKSIAKQYPSGPIHDRLTQTVEPVVDEWLVTLDELEQALEKLYGQHNLTRELAQTKFDIQTLRRKMYTAGSKELIYLRKLLESKKQRYAVLKELITFQTQAELKIHQIASDLGTTHAEMLLIVARGNFNETRLNDNLQKISEDFREMLIPSSLVESANRPPRYM